MLLRQIILSIFLVTKLVNAEHAVPTSGNPAQERHSNKAFDSSKIKTLKNSAKTTLNMWHAPSEELPQDYRLSYGYKGFTIVAITPKEFGFPEEDRNSVFYRSSFDKDRELQEIHKAAKYDKTLILEVEIDTNSTTQSEKPGFGYGSGSKFTLTEVKKIIYRGTDGKPVTLYLGK